MGLWQGSKGRQKLPISSWKKEGQSMGRAAIGWALQTQISGHLIGKT